LNPILRIATDFVHQSTSGPVRRLLALLPILHCAHRNAKKFGKYRLACTELLPCLLDLPGTVKGRCKLQSHGATRKPLRDVLPRLDSTSHPAKSSNKG